MTIQATRYPVRKFVTVGLVMLGVMLSPALAQTAEQELPLVIDGNMPLYPIMARAARIQGVVTIKSRPMGRKSLLSKWRADHRCL
jgi:hypothetical protein